MSILVLQSSWWGRESCLLCLICLPGVSLWMSGSSSRCHRVVCSLWLWYILIILIYYFLCRRWWWGILPKAFSCVSQYRLFWKCEYAMSLYGFCVYATCTEYYMFQRLAGNGVKTLVCMSLVCFYPSFLEICLVNCPSSPKKYRQCPQAVDPGDMFYGRCCCSKFVHPGITNIGLSCPVW